MRHLHQFIPTQQPEARPIDKRAFIRLPADQIGHCGGSRCWANHPTRHASCHFHSVGALNLSGSQYVRQHAVGGFFDRRQGCVRRRLHMLGQRRRKRAHALVKTHRQNIAQMCEFANA